LKNKNNNQEELKLIENKKEIEGLISFYKKKSFLIATFFH